MSFSMDNCDRQNLECKGTFSCTCRKLVRIDLTFRLSNFSSFDKYTRQITLFNSQGRYCIFGNYLNNTGENEILKSCLLYTENNFPEIL